MTLMLSIENVGSLTSGDPIQIQLDEHGLVIGRAAHADWTLPDPRNYISSIHCEIDYVDGRYLLTDRSTNGTFVNGSSQRLPAPYELRDGDLITIGHYEIRASVIRAACAPAASPMTSTGLDWAAAAGDAASQPVDPAQFGRPPAQPLFQSASDPLMSAFAPPCAAPAPAPAPNPFGLLGESESAPTPALSAPPAPPPADNPWAQLYQFGAVDFGAVEASPAPAPTSAPAAKSDEAGLFNRFLAAAGLRRHDIGDASPESVLEAAGQLLRQTADGLIRLLEARARVRHQFGVGAQVTTFQRAGNNPLKWTRSPEQALRQLVGAPDPGFLPGPQAVRGAYEDLQAHEMAMIAAMQEALQATLERFSPEAIKSRATISSRLRSLLPGAREAALWRAYEAEFKAIADETEAAYLDLFAKQFRKAYERNVKKVDLS